MNVKFPQANRRVLVPQFDPVLVSTAIKSLATAETIFDGTLETT